MWDDCIDALVAIRSTLNKVKEFRSDVMTRKMKDDALMEINEILEGVGL